MTIYILVFIVFIVLGAAFGYYYINTVSTEKRNRIFVTNKTNTIVDDTVLTLNKYLCGRALGQLQYRVVVFRNDITYSDDTSKCIYYYKVDTSSDGKLYMSNAQEFIDEHLISIKHKLQIINIYESNF